MNKIILTLLMTILFTPAVNAQNCVNSARCDELGYTKAAADCDSLDTLKCPFDENKVFCIRSQNHCDEGDILFSDKSCATRLQPGKTAIGIVFSSISRLAIALDETFLRWGENNIELGSKAQSSSGKSNTAAILAYGKANNISYPVAEYCNNYSTVGTKAGDWWLPSKEELLLLAANYTIVNEKLTTLKGKIINTGYYWSSSEKTSDSAWGVVVSSSIIGGVTKGNGFSDIFVRPVLNF